MQWIYRLVMVAGALNVSGCRTSDRQPAKVLQETARTSLRVAPNVIVKVDTSHSADTVRKLDTTFYHSKALISIDSLRFIVQSPAEIGGISYGPSEAPFAVLCDTTKGYTATIAGIGRAKWIKVVENGDTVERQDTIYNRIRNNITQAELDSAAKCKVKLALRISREELRDPVTRKLSVSEALREIRTWPKSWATHPAFLSFHLGDDPADDGWGYTMPQRLVMWDQIACGAQQRFGKGTPLFLRARPVQMERIREVRATVPPDSAWECMTTAMAQWVHRLGHPNGYFQTEITSAKKQKLGFVSAINYLNGGCGNLPASVRPPRAACYAPGTSIRGPDNGMYQVSAAELQLSGNAALDDPYVCAHLSWSWWQNFPSPVPDSLQFQNIPANITVLKALSKKARSHPVTSCIQR